MMSHRLSRPVLLGIVGLLSAFGFTSCGVKEDTRNKMIVSVRDQKMLLVRDGKPIKSYKISTSKFGIGDRPGSNYTPLGHMRIAKKIGGNAVPGTVFKSRRPTREIVQPNAPGRDPIVSRIMWLSGCEPHNSNTFRRYIYIHGTPEESRLGTPASYGCIRMGVKDVVDLYNRVGTGADVYVTRNSLQSLPATQSYVRTTPVSRRGQ
ncbi:MAG: L,D-transpeptidase [Luteolibacter sp.]